MVGTRSVAKAQKQDKIQIHCNLYKKKFYFDQLKQTVLNSGKLTKKLNLTNANSNSKLY